MTNFEIIIIFMSAMIAFAYGRLWCTDYNEKKLKRSIQNIVSVEELEHLDCCLDKVEDGEKLIVGYERQLYAIEKIDE